MKNNFKGCFIVIEGIDNSGKTTLMRTLRERLTSKSYPKIRSHFKEKIVFSSEPYGQNPISLKHRQLTEILFSDNYELEPESEALLFLAARKEHIATCIQPALEKGSLVICDRFYLSNLVYQGFIKGVNLQWLVNNIFFIAGHVIPQITFFVEVSKEQYNFFSLQKKEKEQNNKYDTAEITFEQLQNSYNQAINYLNKRGEIFVSVPFNLNMEEKAGFILDYLDEFLKNKT